jgi:hypothetical protein
MLVRELSVVQSAESVGEPFTWHLRQDRLGVDRDKHRHAGRLQRSVGRWNVVRAKGPGKEVEAADALVRLDGDLAQRKEGVAFRRRQQAVVVQVPH